MARFSILQVLDRIYLELILALFAFARLRKINLLAFENQNWFPYKFANSMLIILRVTALLKRVLQNGTQKWEHGAENVCLVYRGVHDSVGMMREIAKVAWLRYFAHADCYY